MATEYCRDCRHYCDTNSILGLCRRYPTYQNRSPQETCGEYKGKAVAELTPEPSGDFLPVEKPKRMGRPPKVTTTPVNFSGVITKKVEVAE
jgi:hypothetical protein